MNQTQVHKTLIAEDVEMEQHGTVSLVGIVVGVVVGLLGLCAAGAVVFVV